MENLIILTGPTGIGKTELSLSLAETFNGEIISCDSMQIYRHMNIGTAKIDLKNTKIPHYLIDIREPWEKYSVADFKSDATHFISDINQRGKMPFLVGGTGLYINSIVYQLNFSVEPNWNLRNQLQVRYEKEGLQSLVNELVDVCPKEANLMDLNNPKRVLRALEVYYSGGKRDILNFRKKNEDYHLIYFALDMNRQKLYDRINHRVDQMLACGLLEEVEMLLKDGIEPNNQSMSAIGYKEVVSFLQGNIDYPTMVETLKQNSRRYAKRQLTWFRRDDRIQWMDREDPNLLENMKRIIGETFGTI